MDRANEGWDAATRRLKVMFDEMRNEQIKQQGNAFFYAMDAEAEIVSACAKFVLEEADSHNLSSEEALRMMYHFSICANVMYEEYKKFCIEKWGPRTI